MGPLGPSISFSHVSLHFASLQGTPWKDSCMKLWSVTKNHEQSCGNIENNVIEYSNLRICPGPFQIPPISYPNPSKNFSKMDLNHSQIGSKAYQNRREMLKKHSRAPKRRPIGGQIFPRSAFRPILAPTWLPKPSKMEGKSQKNRC